MSKVQEGAKNMPKPTTMLRDASQVIKIVKTPISKNEVSIRVQNLEDKFDSTSRPFNVSVYEYAVGMWKESNPSFAGDANINIQETSVTGNMAVRDMEDRRIQWNTTTSEGAYTAPKEFIEADYHNVTVLPQ